MSSRGELGDSVSIVTCDGLDDLADGGVASTASNGRASHGGPFMRLFGSKSLPGLISPIVGETLKRRADHGDAALHTDHFTQFLRRVLPNTTHLSIPAVAQHDTIFRNWPLQDAPLPPGRPRRRVLSSVLICGRSADKLRGVDRAFLEQRTSQKLYDRQRPPPCRPT